MMTMTMQFMVAKMICVNAHFTMSLLPKNLNPYVCILYMPFIYVQPHLLLVIGLLLFGPSFLNTGPFDKNMDSSSSFTLLQTSTGTFISI